MPQKCNKPDFQYVLAPIGCKGAQSAICNEKLMVGVSWDRWEGPFRGVPSQKGASCKGRSGSDRSLNGLFLLRSVIKKNEDLGLMYIVVLWKKGARLGETARGTR